MTEKEANNKLKINEHKYFQLFPDNPTQYAAVIKKSNDFEIVDDYIIEIGLKDFSVDHDTPQSLIEYIKNKRKLSFELQNDILNQELIPVESNEFELHSKKLTAGKSTSYHGSLINSGSIGALFKLRDSNKIYLLSNRHVIVDSDDTSINNEIVSPARSDVRSDIDESEVIGRIIWSSGKDSDILDAAIAEIYDFVEVEIGKYIKSKHLEFNNIESPSIGENIKKYGKSSKLTYGEIKSINCTVNVSKKIDKPKIYRHQILTTNISTNGDSGSCIVNKDNNVIGVVVGGNKLTASFCNNIDYIFNEDQGPIFNFYKFV